jgi:cation transport ATPase
MPISSAEAAASLQEAETIGRRTRTAGAYGVASPHLILWGAIWCVGYAGSGFAQPQYWGFVWLPLIVIGAIGTTLLGRRGAISGARRRGPAGMSILMSLAIAAFMGSVYIVFQPVATAAYLVFPALVAALVYVIVGAYGFPRFIWIGCGIFLAAMASFLCAQAWLPFAIAVAGGGGLVLGGLWLRKV